MNFVRRRRLIVDPKIQGDLIARTVMYWLFCLLTVTLLLLCWQIATSPGATIPEYLDQLWYQFSPPAIASLLLLPLLMMDAARVTNRVVGPMNRMHQAMRDAADGKPVQPITFRDADYWGDFADDFNRLIARSQKLTAAAREDADVDTAAIPAGPTNAEPPTNRSAAASP